MSKLMGISRIRTNTDGKGITTLVANEMTQMSLYFFGDIKTKCCRLRFLIVSGSTLGFLGSKLFPRRIRLVEQLRYPVEQYLIYGIDIMTARYDALEQVPVCKVLAVNEGIRKLLHGINLRSQVRICGIGGTATAVDDEILCGFSTFGYLLCQIFRGLL